MNSLLSELKRRNMNENIKIYVVGGYVRDLVLGRPNKDVDIVMDGDVEKVVHTIGESLGKKVIRLGEKHKLYRIIDDKNNLTFDFTAMKGDTIEEDLGKRDITINSLAIEVIDLDDYNIGAIIDPYGGVNDIENRKIKHVYDEAFKEDPIRIIRALRFMSELDFIMDEATKKLIQNGPSRLDKMPGERISQEIFKILSNKKTHYYFNYMDKELNILEDIFPEIREMREVGECKYHVVDCFTHSIYTLEMIEKIIYAKDYFEDHLREAYERHTNEIIASGHKRLALIKLGALFHDIGKPSARKVDETGRVRFKGHEITGAEMIKGIAERLKISIKERDILYRIVAKHMIPLVLYKSNDVSGKPLYSMFTQLKGETLDVLLIALADIIATRRLLDPEEEMGKFKVHIEYIVNNYLTRYKEVEDISDILTGRDIMEQYKLEENVMVGDLIEEVKKAIYNGRISRRKEAALKYVKEILN